MCMIRRFILIVLVITYTSNYFLLYDGQVFCDCLACGAVY